MEHIRSILSEILSRDRIRDGLAVQEFFSRWNDIVGESLASQTKPIRVIGGVLWVHVESAALKHHLTYFTPKILENIRKRAPGTRIYSIRFTILAES